MTHDIDDLLEIIKQLEERIIKLETIIENNKSMRLIQGIDNSSWYWEHG